MDPVAQLSNAVAISDATHQQQPSQSHRPQQTPALPPQSSLNTDGSPTRRYCYNYSCYSFLFVVIYKFKVAILFEKGPVEEEEGAEGCTLQSRCYMLTIQLRRRRRYYPQRAI